MRLEFSANVIPFRCAKPFRLSRGCFQLSNALAEHDGFGTNGLQLPVAMFQQFLFLRYLISEMFNLAIEVRLECRSRCMVLLKFLVLFSKGFLQLHQFGSGFLADTGNFGCRYGFGLGVERLQLCNA